MTNRDVIDKMTNKELGRFLAHIDCANCAYYSEDGPHVCSKMDEHRETTEIDTCAEGHAKWLDQEPDFRMADYIHEEGDHG